MNQLKRQFQMLRDAGEQIGQILRDPGRWHLLPESLSQREALIDALRSETQAPDDLIEQNKIDQTSMKKLKQSIQEIDSRNMELIRAAIDKTSHSLAEVAKERNTVKRLRSMTKMGHKQLVDFVH